MGRPPTLRHCSGCDTSKPTTQFRRDRRQGQSTDGRYYFCLDCDTEPETRDPRYGVRIEDKEKLKLLKELANACGMRVCSSCHTPKELDEFYEGEHRCKICCVDRSNKFNRKRKTGWTQEEYDAAYVAQDGKCAVCKKNQLHKQLAADHCHQTKTKRGLLCGECNFLIGKAGDDPVILRAAAEYIEFWSLLDDE